MNIILISNFRNRSFKLALSPVSMFLLSGLIFVLCSIFYYSGYFHAKERTFKIVENARQETTSIWEADITQQQDTLNGLKMRTEKALDAMAGRVSILQGYIMRLDALGSRLSSMTNLDDIEFGIANPPGLGGPFKETNKGQVDISDLVNSFDQLDYTLKDRSEKLMVMESMLINQNLQQQILPSGKPSLGGYLSSLFGYRTNPISGKKEFHEGIDFAGKQGTSIIAVAAGIVTWSGARYGYGNLIEISHGNGYITRYAHNHENLVAIGEKVERGEIIGTMGSTGRSTGAHVHFEVIHNGRHVDPKKYLLVKK